MGDSVNSTKTPKGHSTFRELSAKSRHIHNSGLQTTEEPGDILKTWDHKADTFHNTHYGLRRAENGARSRKTHSFTRSPNTLHTSQPNPLLPTRPDPLLPPPPQHPSSSGPSHHRPSSPTTASTTCPSTSPS